MQHSSNPHHKTIRVQGSFQYFIELMDITGMLSKPYMISAPYGGPVVVPDFRFKTMTDAVTWLTEKLNERGVAWELIG